jgi:DNA-binding LacI/PurR family transcriptional regulator
VADRRVTLQTIADAVGVSRTTVSNAYNRPDQLAPSLRELILSRARDLGYGGPDPAARRLRSGRRDTIGLLFTEQLGYAFTDPAAVLLLQGIARATEAAGSSLLLIPARECGTPRDLLRDAVVDGFCLYSLSDGHPAIATVVERGLPSVVVDEPRTAGLSFVGIDDRAGARAVARHLIELGHRRFGVILDRVIGDGVSGFVDASRLAGGTYRVTRDRMAGYADALTAAGVALDGVPVVEAATNARDEGAAGARRLLDRDPGLTAILAMTDQLALGALEVLRERGAAVPGAVSLVGFDDIPEAATASPPLTTVRQPLARKGEEAGRLLVAPPARPAEVLLDVELVARGSTGPHPGPPPAR